MASMRKIIEISRRSVAIGQGGASAAEFALMLPLLLTMMFGTLQVSMLMYSYNVMVSAARDATRAMAVCTITEPGQARTQSLTSKPSWLTDGDWATSATIGDDVSMTISVPATKAGILSYVPFGLGTLTASMTMRKEPLAFGNGSC